MKITSTAKTKIGIGVLGAIATFIVTAVTFASDLSNLWNSASAQPAAPTFTQTATGGGNVAAQGNVHTTGQGDGNTSGNNNFINQKIDKSITNNFNSAPQPEKVSTEQQRRLRELIGVWDNHYCYLSKDNSKLCLAGKMSYFPNGIYNYAAEAVLSKLEGVTPFEYKESVNTAGRWTLSGDILMMENIDLKSTPTSLTVDGKSYDALIGLPGFNLKGQQGSMVVNQTTQYKLSALGNGRMTAHAFDPRGPKDATLFVVESVKRPGQF